LAFKKPPKGDAVKLLAIDCSTERMSLALSDNDQRWQRESVGRLDSRHHGLAG
jgi:tRNA A37 threonylcarbamoyladenosine modification protein TsaB